MHMHLSLCSACNGPIRIPSCAKLRSQVVRYRCAGCALRCGGCANDALRLPIRQVISLDCAKVVCPKGIVHFEGAVFEST